jgi:hypothetical protein
MLSGMSHVECWKLSKVSANTAVAIFIVGCFRKSCIGRAVGGEGHVTNLIGWADERAAIQLETITSLRKRGDENYKIFSRAVKVLSLAYIGDEKFFKGNMVRRKWQVLMTIWIGKRGYERISATTWKGEEDFSSAQLATYCLPYIRLPETPSQYTFTLKMAIAMFA